MAQKRKGSVRVKTSANKQSPKGAVMEHTEPADTEHGNALQWVKTFMKAWTQIDLEPENVDTHAVAALACRLYSRNFDSDARTVAQQEWEKDRGVSCFGALS
jgi:hypothetical protein